MLMLGSREAVPSAELAGWFELSVILRPNDEGPMPIASVLALEQSFVLYVISCSRTGRRPVIIMARVRRTRGAGEPTLCVTATQYSWHTVWMCMERIDNKTETPAICCSCISNLK